MLGRWHIIVIAASIAVYVAVSSFAWWLFLICIPLLLYCLIQREKGRLYLLAILASFFGFYLYADYYDKQNVSKLKPSQTTFTGTITSLPIIDGDRLSFQMKLPSNEKLQVFYYISTKEKQRELSALRVGMTCRIDGELKQPSKATNFYAFDYKRYLYFDHIHWLLTPKDLDLKRCQPSGNSLFVSIKQYRQSGIDYINEHFPEELKGISAALIFGHRHMVDENVLSAYQSLGVIHVLAVSGLHVGLLVGALFYLMIRIGITRERVYEILIIFLPIYIILAGAAPSVVRAALMAITVLACLRLKRKINALDGISFIFLIYILISPYALFQLGFQLSFFISYSLILSSQTIFKELSGYIKPLLAVTLQSQLFSLPLILFHFYEFSLLSLPLNLLYIPFISVIVLPAVFFLMFIILLFPQLGLPLAGFFNSIIAFAHERLKVLDQFSWGTVTVGKITELQAVLLFMVIIFGCYCFEKRRRLKDILSPFSLLVSLLLVCVFAPYFQSKGEVTIIDVGQGDSILIELPNRKAVYLIDTGGHVSFGRDESWRERKKQFDVGKDVVVPYLKAKGITKIDKLIVSHGHYDHIGGVFGLIEDIVVKEVLYSKGELETDFERELLKALKASGSNIRFVQEGEKWTVGDEQFYLISPKGHEVGLNQRSLVLYARLGGLNWLFTGDLEEDGEARLIREYANLDVDILKAGHHGSRTSSTPAFLDHIKPRAVVISAGRSNRFSHPHQEVVKAFDERGVKIYRTDLDGAIRFQFSEKRYSILRALE